MHTVAPTTTLTDDKKERLKSLSFYVTYGGCPVLISTLLNLRIDLLKGVVGICITEYEGVRGAFQAKSLPEIVLPFKQLFAYR